MARLDEEQTKRTALRKLLIEFFNEGELRTLCDDLSIDYESLPDQGRANKARELVNYARRHGQLGQLAAEARQLRPHCTWPDFPEPDPIDLTISDPCLEYQVYYLASAAGDSQQQQRDRQQAFTAELQRAADALCRWLGLPLQAAELTGGASSNPSQVIIRYSSGQLQRADGAVWGWLIATHVHDSYMLRLIAERPGRHLQPAVFKELQSELGWQAEPSNANLLGAQLIFYTSRFIGPSVNLARDVLGRGMLLHAALSCGDLYTGRRHDAPYLLVGSVAEQAESAKEFFAVFSLELGWHTHTILSQVRQYYDQLAPMIAAVAQQIADASQNPIAGDLVPRVCQLLQLARMSSAAITTSVVNYRHGIERLGHGNVFAGPDQRELFIERQRELDLIAHNLASHVQGLHAALDHCCASGAHAPRDP